MKHRTGYRYCKCTYCGDEWNISKYDTPGKRYVCPRCEKKLRRKANELEKDN